MDGYRDTVNILSVLNGDVTLEIRLGRPADNTAMKQDRRLSLYPNPARDMVRVELPGGHTVLDVFDMLGIRKFSCRSFEAQIFMDVSSWSPGVHMLSSGARGSRELRLQKLYVLR